MSEEILRRYNVVSYGDLRSEGLSTAEISRAKRCCLMNVCRGIYSIVAECPLPRHSRIRRLVDDHEWVEYVGSTSAEERLRDPRFQQHLARLAVIHYPRYRSGDVAFGVSAALLSELPLFDAELRRITVAHPRASTMTSEVRRLRRVTPDEDQTVIHGVRTAGPVRAGLELISWQGPPAGLAALDLALRRAVIAKTGDTRLGSSNPRRMLTIGREIVGTEFVPAALRLKRGRQMALRILDMVSPLSESYAESRCSFNLHQSGLHDFVQQWNVVHDGALFTRLDFLHRETMTALAVDGVGKYADAGPNRMKRESYQHNTLLSMGFRVVHFTFPEVMNRKAFELKLFEQVPELLAFRRAPLLK